MCTFISEEGIPLKGFRTATVNRSRIWSERIQAIVASGNQFRSVEITFVTDSGSFKANVKIAELFEGYVRTEQGRVIPLVSIVEVSNVPFTSVKIADEGNMLALVYALVVLLALASLIIVCLVRW